MKYLHLLVAGTFFTWLMLFAVYYAQSMITTKIGLSNRTVSLNLSDLARNKEEKDAIMKAFPGHALDTIRPKRKVIMFYIDGFRESFIDGNFINYMGGYHGYRMKVFENEIKNDPEHIQFSTCLADAPTMTIQGVLKFLTGSYQSYLEIANQLKHDDEMLEDSFISQAISKGLKVKYFGGDSIANFYKSTIKDDYITSSKDMKDHSKEWELLYKGRDNIFNGADDWDFFILDSAALDNTGHIYCSNWQQNDDDIRRTEDLIKSIIDNLPQNMTFVILSDHGRDENRDHGGDTLGELYTMFSMHQKDYAFKIDTMNHSILTEGKLKVIPHVSIATIMSNLLQTYIPFSNIGPIQPEYLVYDDSYSSYDINKDMFKAILINQLQLTNYIKRYKEAENGESFKEIIDAMDNLIKEFETDKDLIFELVNSINKENNISNNQTESKKLIIQDINKFRSNFDEKVTKFDSSIKLLWSIPNTKLIPYLFLIALMFLVLFILISWEIRYCSTDGVQSDEKFINLSVYNMKMRYMSVIVQLILSCFVLRNYWLLFFSSLFNFWILYPFLISLFKTETINLLKKDANKSLAIWLVPLLIFVLCTVWSSTIMQNFKLIIFGASDVFLLFFIIYYI